jgi:Na+-transporting NADH:ubiquinone oxidoreductase subunit C
MFKFDRDSTSGTILVAVVLCLACSLLVSGSAEGLKKYQEANKLLDRQKNVLDATGLAQSETGQPASSLSRSEVEQLFRRVDERFVDLKTGVFVEKGKEYDERSALKDSEQSFDISKSNFPIGIPKRERVARVFIVFDKHGQQMEQIVLPIYGKGLWSTLYGFLAVNRDLKTIRGLTFYEHAETPGLGGEVDNPRWKAQWRGLELYSADQVPAVGVSKGPAPKGDKHLVDGLSGATITSNGVTALVRSWLSDDGFGLLLKKISQDPPKKKTT